MRAPFRNDGGGRRRSGASRVCPPWQARQSAPVARPVAHIGVDRAPAPSRASSRTSRARRSPAPWCRRSARRRRSRSPIGAAGSSSARCRPGPISSARISAGSWRRAGRSIDVRAERARVLLDCAAARERRSGTVRPIRCSRRASACRRRRGTDRRRRHAGRRARRTAQASRQRHDDDHGETAWRLRHARRGDPEGCRPCPTRSVRRRRRPRIRCIDRPSAVRRRRARLATSFFADTPFSGQVNLLTTGSFDIAAAAVLGRQLRAQHRLPRARRAGRRARRLDGARRAHAGRHLVVDRRRRVRDARARAASVRRRPLVQHAALRRRQLRRAARRHRRQPQRRRGLRVRHVRRDAGRRR